jgi:endonuclease YncB( thermonuclease family)
VEIIEIDRYERIVGIVHENDLNINRQLVKDGYAWAYREYLKGAYASEFINFERQAREKHLGLWQQSNPTPPWEYRRRNC